MSAHARKRALRAALPLTIALGIGLRLLACVREPPLHPDEYFQYLEPAWWRLNGAGLASWEWQEGLRSWVLPFYNGAWMALLMRLGVRDGPTLGFVLKAHWAVLNSAVIALAFRAGCALTRKLLKRAARRPDEPLPEGYEGGLIAAALCATFPVLVGYAAHTLSELPSMLCLLAGLVITTELSEQPASSARPRLAKAALAGFLLSLGACLRIASAPLALVAPAWLLARGDRRQLVALLLGTLPPALAFGLVDLLTWGSFAGSFVAYVKFNFIEGGAADFGVEPPGFYLEAVRKRAPWGLPFLLLAALSGLRTTWPYLGSAAGLLAYLSTQPHKEERFILAFWPLLLIAAAAPLGALIARRKEPASDLPEVDARAAPRAGAARPTARVVTGAVVALCAALLIEAGHHYARQRSWLSQDRVDAQSWAGRQADLTGLLVDEPYYTGGGLWFGARAPLLGYESALLTNPLVSHVLVRARSRAARESSGAGFVVAHRAGAFVVLRRQPRPQTAP